MGLCRGQTGRWTDRVEDATAWILLAAGLLVVLLGGAFGIGVHDRLADLGVTKSHSRPRCSNDNPVGAENPVTSCDLHVFVDEAAEPVSSEWPDGRLGTWRSVARGRPLMQ